MSIISHCYASILLEPYFASNFGGIEVFEIHCWDTK